MVILIGAQLLTACAPAGAKNWPFSIGPQTYAVALGDLDGDGDLDAFMANGENEVPVPNTVWMNDGRGKFENSGQQIGERESRFVILADMDLDGDLDALVSNTGDIEIFPNDGQGIFHLPSAQLSQPQGGAYVLAPAVGDVNADGWLDVLGGGCCGAVKTWDDGRQQVYPAQDTLWIRDVQGGYIDSGHVFDILGTTAVALGDLDRDGDLDAFFADHSSMEGNAQNSQRPQPNTIWFNHGQGLFTMSSQMLGQSMSNAIVLGDLDGDGDLDAFIGNEAEDELWLNQGGRQGGLEGTFRLSDRVGGRSSTRSLSLADYNGDGSLDVLTVGKEQAILWYNDEWALLTRGPRFSFEAQHALAVGDLNGDGYPDIFAGSVNHAILVWLNDDQRSFSKGN